MKDKRTFIRFLQFFVIFAIIAVVVGEAYNRGIHRPPLMFASIPDATQLFIKQLSRDSKDQGLSYTKQGPFDWDNERDLGNDENDTWKSESDANFIVYYHPGKDATWQSRAQDVLHQAQNNIDYLKDFMGKYYYAEDMNGRKLAIYLPESEDLYKKTISTLMDVLDQGTQGTAGITISQVGPLGCLTRGIVLNPICFNNNNPNDANDYKRVLKHEMCHYVFFSSLNYGKNIHHYLWVSEGIAEYFSNYLSHRPISGTDSITTIKERCHLNKEFPLENNSSYWAGESFFGFLEAEKGKDAVKNFVKNAYTYSTDSVFIVMKYDSRQLHKKWVDVLSHISLSRETDVPEVASQQEVVQPEVPQPTLAMQQQKTAVKEKNTSNTPKSPKRKNSKRRR